MDKKMHQVILYVNSSVFAFEGDIESPGVFRVFDDHDCRSLFMSLHEFIADGGKISMKMDGNAVELVSFFIPEILSDLPFIRFRT